MNKKAMDASQTFVYIATVIVVGLVFLFGVRAILSLNSNAQTIEKVSFVNDFEEAVVGISAEYRALRTIELHIPEKFSELCIVDILQAPPASSTELPALILDEWTSSHDAITLSANNGYDKKNLFLLSGQKVEESFFVDKISIENPGFICVSGETVTLALTGLGDRTAITVQQ